MSDGLSDVDWGMKLDEQRKKYFKLEKQFIETPSIEKAKQLNGILKEYLQMKKGESMWAQERNKILEIYIREESSSKDIVNHLKAVLLI